MARKFDARYNTEYRATSAEIMAQRHERLESILQEMDNDTREGVEALRKALVKIMAEKRSKCGFGEMAASELIYIVVRDGLYKKKRNRYE